MILNTLEDRETESYFKLLNNIIGVTGISLTSFAMQFNNPVYVALAFLIFMNIWAISEGKVYRRVGGAYLKRHNTVRGIIGLTWHLKVFVFGNITLLLVIFRVIGSD